MSDETASSPETSSNAPAETAPRTRRVSNPRPKKAAKSAPTAEASAPATPVKETPKTQSFPDFSEKNNDSQEDQPSRGDWPEPEAPSSGDVARENPKRKRRRKKGKGNNSQNQVSAVEPETSDDSNEQAPAQPSSQGQQPRQHQQAPRPKLDPDLLAKFAWKIYLAEVSEEGVALIGDNDAKELSRRCFRLAEIFMEEQSRRR